MRRRGALDRRPGGGRIRERWSWAAVGLAHVASTLWLFGGVLAGRLVFFRDVSTYYAPQYAFAAGALRQGTWPLWNPLANAGEPFLLVYPVDLLLLLLAGWKSPLGVGVALHLLLALLGASLLGRRLGMGPASAWVTGTVYGLGGFFLSTVNLLPLMQASAWAPLVVWAFVSAAEDATGRRIAVLAVLASLQVSTLGAEIVLQTLVVSVVLVGSRALWRDRRRLGRLSLAGLLAFLLAAPAVLGVRSLLAGTARESGFPLREALSYSLHPVVLMETALPRLLGDPHAFSDRNYWGRAYFPAGFPYFVSLYLGLPALLAASLARDRRRLWLLAAASLVLALGRHGPLGLLPDTFALPVRGPQKLFFIVHLCVALLAGFGVDRAGRLAPSSRRRLALALPGGLLLSLAAAAALSPGALRGLLAPLAPPLLDPRGLVAVKEVWFTAFLTAGTLSLGTGLALARGGRSGLLAAGLIALDLLAVNGRVNAVSPATFYELREDVASLVTPATREGRFRWFSYGVAHTPGLRFEPVMAEAPSDVWLYYLDRQTLLPRAPALDGLEGALDVDRTGWSPAGATLADGEVRPGRFREHYPRLRDANVRWILSFRPLPADLAEERGTVKLPEVQPPLRLYELRGALPRAFWSPDLAGAVARPGGEPVGTVLYETIDPHTVRVSSVTPPGVLVILDGHHPDWTAEDRSGPVALRKVGARWRGVVTPGGPRVFTLRYRPQWPRLAFVLAGLGLLGLLWVGFRGPR